MKSVIIAVILLTVISPAYSIYVSNISEINGNENIITHINFSNKGLTEIPEQVFKCKNLVSLNLSNNGIVSIPRELSELSSLKKLDLSMNRGLNPIDLDEVFENAKFKLTELSLHACNLLYVPSSLNRQSGIKYLDISSNRLTSLPYTFMELSSLETVNVSSNKLRNISWVVNYWWSLKSIDFSDNDGLQVSSVLSVLSYFDQLDEITLSDLDFFPKEFALLNVHRLNIKNSVLSSFVRTNLSTKIDQLYFENCQFEKSSLVVEVLNDFVKPDFVHFSKMNPLSLTEFLNLKADSISLYQLGELDIRPLSSISELKWLDVRGNKIEKSSLNDFKNKRPDVKLMFKEPVKKDQGVHPPIPEFVSKPTLVSTAAGIDQKVEIGRSEFSVPAQGILDEAGNVYEGPVNLEYREFVTPAEILLSGITMTSDKEEETYLFSSGGMFELNATDANGNPLFVNPEQPIQVEMYSNSTNPDMEIFTLNENGDWDVIGNDSIFEPYQFTELNQDSVMEQEDFIGKVNSQVAFVGHRYFPVVKRNKKMNSFEISFKKYKTRDIPKNVRFGTASLEVHNQNYIADLLTTKSFIYEGPDADALFTQIDSISSYCQDKYKRLRVRWWRKDFYTRRGPYFVSEINLMPDLENDRYNLHFKFKQQEYTIPVTLLSHTMDAGGSLNENKRFFSQYSMAWKKAKRMQNSNMRRLNTEITKRVQILKNLADEEKRKSMEIIYLDKLKRNSAGQIIGTSASIAFTILSFGLHNADARVRLPQPDPVSKEFVNEDMDKIKDKAEDIYVVDHSINGVMQYDENDEVFVHKLSKSSVVVFFASGLVGIYHSWMNMRTNRHTELKMYDPGDMDRETFIKLISYEN
jgi:Leucine-rich repeat (LRR) protein/uncharacterized pyridoxamine 5'-phosphate oxidase family protein